MIAYLPSIIPYYSPFKLNLMFCTQSRFTYYFVLYWVRECYEHPHYILPKEGCPSRPHTFFINELAELQRFVLVWFGFLGFITKMYLQFMYHRVIFFRAERGRENLINDDNQWQTHFIILSSNVDYLITIAYHWLSPLLILYLPMQEVNHPDSQIVTELRVK